MQAAHSIFISHSSQDHEVTGRICQHLEDKGLRCWMAPRNIQPGESWAGSIMKAIRNTEIFLLILTKNSNHSVQVMREVERAVNHSIPIICLRLEELSLSDDLEYFLSSIHWITAYNLPLEAILKNLHQGIKPFLPSDQVPPSNNQKDILKEDSIETDTDVQLMVATHAYDKRDYSKALSIFLSLGQQGIAEAQNYIGVIYYDGLGVDSDIKQAITWFRKAAKQGNAEAQNNLGVMYEKGQGVKQNDKMATVWFRKAAKQGVVHAQYKLGWMYDRGLGGVKQNDNQALAWYQKAAEQGHADAQFSLGNLYDTWHNHRWIKKSLERKPTDLKGYSKEKAIAWYRKAAEQGHADAQERLISLDKLDNLKRRR